MSELETAITVLMKTFCTYAGSEGPKNSLSKGEAKTLLQKELPGLLEVAENQAEAFRLLDLNGDSEVVFEEFMAVICGLTCMVYSTVGPNAPTIT